MKKVIGMIMLISILVLSSTSFAKMTENEKDLFILEVFEICLQKLSIEGKPLTQKNLKTCGHQQIRADAIIRSYIKKIRSLPDGKDKLLLLKIILECHKRNILPNKLIDRVETLKCIKKEFKVLKYMLKQDPAKIM